jgi:hypothetical protein
MTVSEEEGRKLRDFVELHAPGRASYSGPKSTTVPRGRAECGAKLAI